MTYEEALNYIHSVRRFGTRPSLDRIRTLTEMLGHPEDKLKFIHVAGTNGKGSVCSMLSSVLREAGYKVGLYTSPFIERFNERIMLDGEEIPDEILAEECEKVRSIADKMSDTIGEMPTEFDLITAIALSYYSRVGCDYVVFECGLGGRFDSTNVINTSVLSIITGIDLDHTAILGNTTAEIAAEKAGIIKNGVPILFGEGDNDSENVIKARAAECLSPYYRTPFDGIHDVKTDIDRTAFSFGDREVQLGLHGIYQTRNAATVLTAVDILRKSGIKIPESAVRNGLINARWKARFERLSSSPLVIYDGAHNPNGISAAVENIKQYLSPLTNDGKIILLMGVMADKDHASMIKALSHVCAKAFTVTPENARSLDSVGVKREFRENGVVSEAYDGIFEGVKNAVLCAAEEKRPLVCLGSLYMYSDVKKAVYDSLEIINTRK